MKKYNVWKSTITGAIYEMPLDFIPQYEGWEFMGTVEK